MKKITKKQNNLTRQAHGSIKGWEDRNRDRDTARQKWSVSLAECSYIYNNGISKSF